MVRVSASKSPILGSNLSLGPCGDIRLILRLRIDDLSDFRSTAATEYGEREESLAERGEPGEYFLPTIVPSLLL